MYFVFYQSLDSIKEAAEVKKAMHLKADPLRKFLLHTNVYKKGIK